MAGSWNCLARNCAIALLACAGANAQAETATNESKTFAKVDEIFADYALDNHIPGLVYGIVSNGKLIHVRGIGVQDLESRRPVTRDTLFRIASMSKAFTALTVLKLRDEGKLRLDAPAETYVPEMRGWTYPTQDSPRIRVRDLLNHTAGFVTDDPWGDRQTPMPEAEFTKLLARRRAVHPPAGHGLGVLEPGLRPARPHHHQCLRTSVCRHHHADVAEAARHGRPRDSSSMPRRANAARSAIAGKTTRGGSSRRWRTAHSAPWAASRPAPTTTPGGSPIYCPRGHRAMRRCRAGEPRHRARARARLQLSAWVPAAGRPSGPGACALATSYGMGFIVSVGCDFGVTMSHGGGYPGYGSHVLLIPAKGLGVFAFANRTYAGPSGAVWDAAAALSEEDILQGPAAARERRPRARVSRRGGDLQGRATSTQATDHSP